MDQTKRPLLIPPEFATYAEQHGVFDLYKVLYVNSQYDLLPGMFAILSYIFATQLHINKRSFSTIHVHSKCFLQI